MPRARSRATTRRSRHPGEREQSSERCDHCAGSRTRPSAIVTNAVGPRGEGRVVGDQQHGATGAQPFDRLADDPCARGVEVRGRLVEDDERSVAEEGAGDRDALALAGRERATALADDRLVPLGKPVDHSGRPGLRRRLAHARRPRRPGRRAGCCRRSCRETASGPGAPRRSAGARLSGSHDARSVSPTRIRPAAGAWKRSSSVASVHFPPPLGPTRATVSPGAIVERDVGESRGRPSRIGERDGLEPDRGLASARRRAACPP